MAILEVLIAVCVGLILIAIGWTLLAGSTRNLTRGQNKLNATTQVELVYRHLENDVHAATAVPAWPSSGADFTLVRTSERVPGAVKVVTISWRFVPVANGAGSYIERAVDGLSPPEPPTRFCVDMLHAAKVGPLPGGSSDHPGMVAALEIRSIHDNESAEFTETFFFQNQVPDPFWIPVP